MPLFKSQPLICLVFCETNECVKCTMHRLIFTVKLYLTKPSNTLESTTTTINESLSSDDSISNDTLSALVKKSRDLSHLQKNLLTKSRTRERQTKST